VVSWERASETLEAPHPVVLTEEQAPPLALQAVAEGEVVDLLVGHQDGGGERDLGSAVGREPELELLLDRLLETAGERQSEERKAGGGGGAMGGSGHDAWILQARSGDRR
jgi:hypothetical protein